MPDSQPSPAAARPAVAPSSAPANTPAPSSPVDSAPERRIHALAEMRRTLAGKGTPPRANVPPGSASARPMVPPQGAQPDTTFSQAGSVLDRPPSSLPEPIAALRVPNEVASVSSGSPNGDPPAPPASSRRSVLPPAGADQNTRSSPVAIDELETEVRPPPPEPPPTLASPPRDDLARALTEAALLHGVDLT